MIFKIKVQYYAQYALTLVLIPANRFLGFRVTIYKVQVFKEGLKTLTKSPSCFEIYSVILF